MMPTDRGAVTPGAVGEQPAAPPSMQNLFGEPLRDPPRQLTIGEMLNPAPAATPFVDPQPLPQVPAPAPMPEPEKQPPTEQGFAPRPWRNWPPPWNKETPADRRIAKQFKPDETGGMF